MREGNRLKKQSIKRKKKIKNALKEYENFRLMYRKELYYVG